MDWLPRHHRVTWTGMTTCLIPLWMLLALSAAATAALWWLQPRFAYRGHCRWCNYNLAGLNPGPCPECGR